MTRIKLDRHFVSTLETNERSRTILANTINLARDLQLDVTAEGVENAAQLAWLRGLGCDAGQGYLFGKPQRQDLFFSFALPSRICQSAIAKDCFMLCRRVQGLGISASLATHLRSVIVTGFLCLTASMAQAQEAPNTLEKIARTKTIILGHRQNEFPFSYVYEGRPIGYSVELCEYVVKALEKKLQLDKITIQFLPATTAARFVLMRSGKMDMECAETTNNAERRKMVDFSLPHFLTATRFVSLKSSHINTIADLSGRSVASTTGTVNIEQLNAVNRSRNLNISVMINKEHKDSFCDGGKRARLRLRYG